LTTSGLSIGIEKMIERMSATTTPALRKVFRWTS
jgi:hypothetical protein